VFPVLAAGRSFAFHHAGVGDAAHMPLSFETAPKGYASYCVAVVPRFMPDIWRPDRLFEVMGFLSFRRRLNDFFQRGERKSSFVERKTAGNRIGLVRWLQKSRNHADPPGNRRSEPVVSRYRAGTPQAIGKALRMLIASYSCAAFRVECTC